MGESIVALWYNISGTGKVSFALLFFVLGFWKGWILWGLGARALVRILRDQDELKRELESLEGLAHRMKYQTTMPVPRVKQDLERTGGRELLRSSGKVKLMPVAARAQMKQVPVSSMFESPAAAVADSGVNRDDRPRLGNPASEPAGPGADRGRSPVPVPLRPPALLDEFLGGARLAKPIVPMRPPASVMEEVSLRPRIAGVGVSRAKLKFSKPFQSVQKVRTRSILKSGKVSSGEPRLLAQKKRGGSMGGVNNKCSWEGKFGYRSIKKRNGRALGFSKDERHQLLKGIRRNVVEEEAVSTATRPSSRRVGLKGAGRSNRSRLLFQARAEGRSLGERSEVRESPIVRKPVPMETRGKVDGADRKKGPELSMVAAEGAGAGGGGGMPGIRRRSGRLASRRRAMGGRRISRRRPGRAAGAMMLGGAGAMVGAAAGLAKTGGAASEAPSVEPIADEKQEESAENDEVKTLADVKKLFLTPSEEETPASRMVKKFDQEVEKIVPEPSEEKSDSGSIAAAGAAAAAAVAGAAGLASNRETGPEDQESGGASSAGSSSFSPTDQQTEMPSGKPDEGVGIEPASEGLTSELEKQHPAPAPDAEDTSSVQIGSSAPESEPVQVEEPASSVSVTGSSVSEAGSVSSASASDSSSEDRDDLTVLGGVDEEAQRKLNELGYTRFEQLAELNEKDFQDLV
ncbi:MAG: hypothetical protein AAF514_10870, partial [Verrucomicrobiota bacterium]